MPNFIQLSLPTIEISLFLYEKWKNMKKRTTEVNNIINIKSTIIDFIQVLKKFNNKIMHIKT